ncbi:hypothetical protein KK062_08970 [Fulvivirgaceae bacterium PWU5]|uniref:Uncharacterized protein n=1 Tax=Dawidia cretensis TaxID=2782350 RepID=A0AAP2DXU1_9BACT|nr:hypothetical protein [Dawidia cretensis]MBT1708354.1 hypothetical protein [Dawidia cretensis]
MHEFIHVALSAGIIVGGCTKTHSMASAPANASAELSQQHCTVKVVVDKQLLEKEYFEYVWKINGREVQADSTQDVSFIVPAHSGLDTIYFIKPHYKTEMILVDLVAGETYDIEYNTCCSDFDFARAKYKDVNASVAFTVQGKPRKKLIGGVGFGAAYLKSHETVTLNGSFLRSAMFPNRYHVFVQQYLPGSEEETIARIVNPESMEEVGIYRDSDKSIIDFQYIFLDDDQVTIDIDVKNHTATVREVSRP